MFAKFEVFWGLIHTKPEKLCEILKHFLEFHLKTHVPCHFCNI